MGDISGLPLLAPNYICITKSSIILWFWLFHFLAITVNTSFLLLEISLLKNKLKIATMFFTAFWTDLWKTPSKNLAVKVATLLLLSLTLNSL